MKPLPHHYDTRMAAVRTVCDVLSRWHSRFALRAPADFEDPATPGVPSTCCSPRLQTCFLFTLRSVAKLSKFQKWLELSAHGVLDRKEA